ncbi:UDP-glycosyltransferase 83A1-like [Senna tora]|uniref:UDP-glycosyltransferase 83A1-like n=1 Tax=Senna tora TaxID=362788 RepID=A0A834VYS7_9FABA|nr:UDP-glycosyltransferase 83A1-like [Senna tora]
MSSSSSKAKAHILVVPLPAQGHVNPLMQLSHELVKQNGIKITFVNTDYTHSQIMKSLEAEGGGGKCNNDENIRMVSIPDGLEDGESRNCNFDKLFESLTEVVPKKLEMVIREINERESDDKISCVVADGNMGMALLVAEKMGIKRAAVWTASAACFALYFSIPKLLRDEIIDSDGTPTEDKFIQLSPNMPIMRTKHFFWTQFGDDDLDAKRIVFNFVLSNIKALEVTDWVICNSTQELEPSPFAFSPKMLPIGPLLASKNNHARNLAASFWPEDSTCLNWLDQQENNSVIYIAFGSFTIFDLTQLQELALGLELSNKPFLWVIRPDINNESNQAFLKKFEERLPSHGKIVGWAPQKEVLGHPSIACFLSHCGWNSTIEGVINGIPFLCWPYFADQFLNETYICDIWKVGLRVNRNNNGIISQVEIRDKIKQVLRDEGFKARALEMKERAINSVKEGGSSNKNLKSFIDWIKT